MADAVTRLTRALVRAGWSDAIAARATARLILAADPTIGPDMDLGAAWRAVVGQANVEAAYAEVEAERAERAGLDVSVEGERAARSWARASARKRAGRDPTRD